jgi:hypothetical protein
MSDINIASSNVLVELNISVWSARKLDKSVSKEIDVNKNTTTKAGNYNKHLLAGSDALAKIQKHASEIRDWHMRQTLPWSSSGGIRLLPMTQFFDYKKQMDEHEELFKERVNKFIGNYPNIVDAMAYKLGQLFDRSEYPIADELQRKFKINYTFLPVPEVNHFDNINNQMRQDLKEQYEKAYNDRVEFAMKSAWTRLHDTVNHMVERLSGEDKKIFRDTLVTNALELTGMLSSLNITKDPKLETARQRLEKIIVGVDAEDLRQSDALRKDVASKVSELMELI